MNTNAMTTQDWNARFAALRNTSRRSHGDQPFPTAVENLQDTSLNFLDLGFWNFRGANLEGADFSHSDLRGVDFTGANLYRATFRYNNLAAASGGILQITGLMVEQIHLIPTWKGWSLTIGDWRGTPDDLHESLEKGVSFQNGGKLYPSDRVLIETILKACELHMARWVGLINELFDRWGPKIESETR